MINNFLVYGLMVGFLVFIVGILINESKLLFIGILAFAYFSLILSCCSNDKKEIQNKGIIKKVVYYK